jgi:cytochrome c oxidase assembly protein subunit 15
MEEVLKVALQEKQAKANRQVAMWLLVGIGMVIIQILLGGITRLTGSGLSITEWDVVTGTLPPLNEASWMAEFEKYRLTPQYRLLNSDFTLADFKFIFFWEWFHRLWGRLIGLVFAAGFIYFLATSKFARSMVAPLAVLFVLGGLQGAIGWIMVASGLVGDAVYVRPTRLALHFVFALGLLCYTLWFALKLRVEAAQRIRQEKLRNLLLFMMFFLVLQLSFGALMAGHKAATAAPTWPTINGSMLSSAGLFDPAHGWLNFIDNKITIQFMHRTLAYMLLALTALLTLKIYRPIGSGLLYQYRWWPLGIVALQVVLGIASVLSSTGIVPNRWGLFEWMAQLHQLIGMLYLMCMVALLFLTTAPAKASVAK